MHYLVTDFYVIRAPFSLSEAMKFEDLLMQRSDERQKRLDLEEEVRSSAYFPVFGI